MSKVNQAKQNYVIYKTRLIKRTFLKNMKDWVYAKE
jgi:hypothetical protein